MHVFRFSMHSPSSGCVEYTYAFVSAEIGKYLDSKGIVNEHYSAHAELDLEHAAELFELIEPCFEALESLPEGGASPAALAAAEASKSGIMMGHAAILDLFDELADMVESNVGFANVMEDCSIERAIAHELRSKLLQQHQAHGGRCDSSSAGDLLRVAMIGSAGCTALSVLGDGPLKLDIVDANPSQLRLISTKVCLMAVCVHMSGGSNGVAEAAYLRYLRGQANAEELEELRAAEAETNGALVSMMQSLQQQAVHPLGLSPLAPVVDHQGSVGGLCGDGRYEAIFRKLAAFREAGAPEAEAFAVAFDGATTDRRFGGKVGHHCSKTLADGFRELIGWESENGSPCSAAATACKGVRNAYFKSLIEGRACDPGTPAPPYASRLAEVAAGLAESDVGLHASDMAGFLEGQPAGSYDMVQVSNVTDWMSTEEVARLLKACRSVIPAHTPRASSCICKSLVK